MSRIVRLPRPDFRWFLGLVIAGVLGVVGRTAPPDEPRGGEVVTMSPFEVSANRFDFIGWQIFRSPHFVVYSDGGEKAVSRVVRELEMLHLAAQQLLERAAPPHAPVIVVLPSSSSDWRKLRSRGNVRWRVSVSTFQRFAYYIVAEYDWEREGAKTLWSALGGLEASWIGPEPSFAVSKGICSYFETATFEADQVVLGGYNPREQFLVEQGWMDWDRVFAITNQSREYTNEAPDLHRFMAQSALFVQYLFDESAPLRRRKMRQWNSVFEAGWRPTETLFAAIFGSDFAAFQKDAEQAVWRERSRTRTFKFTAAELDFPVVTESVKARPMRELFVLTQILNQRVDASEAALDSLLGQGLETAALRGLLVEACLNWNRREAAAKVLDELMAADAVAPEVYAMAASLRVDSIVKRELDVSVRLSPEDARQIQTWCDQALALAPYLAQANEVSALAAGWGPTVDAAQSTLIKTRFEALSDRGPVDGCLAALAMAEWRLGNDHEARRVCVYLLRYAAVRLQVRRLARTMLNELDRREAQGAAVWGEGT